MNAKLSVNRGKTFGHTDMNRRSVTIVLGLERPVFRLRRAVPGEILQHLGMKMAADTAAEKRLQRQIDNHRENEARWLQKVLFATGKARDAREKLADATNEQLNPLITLDNGDQIPLDTLEEIIQKRVDDLNVALGRGVYTKKK